MIDITKTIEDTIQGVMRSVMIYRNSAQAMGYFPERNERIQAAEELLEKKSPCFQLQGALELLQVELDRPYREKVDNGEPIGTGNRVDTRSRK